MAHKDWCGKPCHECKKPCGLDESMPCSPDCEALNENGTRNFTTCKESGCDAIIEKEGECPVCGYPELKYGHSELQDESYVYEWECEECGATGEELYALTFECHIVD